MRTSVLAALALLAVLPRSGRGQEAVPADPAAVASLDAVLAPIRERHAVPALGGAILDTSGLRAVGAVGVRARGSDEPVTVDDPWHLGSCTKAMTATLLARLVERGQLGWERPLAELFPDQADAMDPAWRSVTLDHLLSHRAGLASERDMELLALRRSAAPLVEQRRSVVTYLTAAPPDHEPGSGFRYSNAGYVIAGAAAEAATGQPWEALLREEVFEPLGMSSAGFGPPGRPGAQDAPRGHQATKDGYAPLDPGGVADNPEALGPAGTVHASLADWARFATLHLRGGRGEAELLLAPETFALLHRPRGSKRYALGWGVAEREELGAAILSHDGSNTLWYASVTLVPELGVGVLAVTNAGDEAAQAAVHEAARALLARARAAERDER